jgi:Uma2 family endonuclease
MSTIPRSPAAAQVRNRNRPAGAHEASFEYGYRLVPRPGRNGRTEWQRIPLTLHDVLHPREGDVLVLSDPHADDCTYLRIVLKDRYAAERSVAVLSDCGIYWDIPGLEHHSPDLAVIFGVKRRKGWRSFRVKTEKVWPSLIIEVTSPKTRVTDVETKVQEYARARVPHYVIADAAEAKGRRKLTLRAYRLKGGAYAPAKLDARGRAWLEPVGLWLGVAVNPETGDDRLALIDPAIDEEIGDYTAIRRAREAAEARAAAEAQARAAAEARAAAAEARLRRVEAELRRLRGRKA